MGSGIEWYVSFRKKAVVLNGIARKKCFVKRHCIKGSITEKDYLIFIRRIRFFDNNVRMRLHKVFIIKRNMRIVVFRKRLCRQNKEESVIMAQTLVNIRMDEELKKNMEQTCQELGMNMTTAITIFAKKMTREKRIPFDVSVDPFYSESNMAHLRRGVEALNAGKGVEHDIIEADE